MAVTNSVISNRCDPRHLRSRCWIPFRRDRLRWRLWRRCQFQWWMQSHQKTPTRVRHSDMLDTRNWLSREPMSRTYILSVRMHLHVRIHWVWRLIEQWNTCCLSFFIHKPSIVGSNNLHPSALVLATSIVPRTPPCLQLQTCWAYILPCRMWENKIQ